MKPFRKYILVELIKPGEEMTDSGIAIARVSQDKTKQRTITGSPLMQGKILTIGDEATKVTEGHNAVFVRADYWKVNDVNGVVHEDAVIFTYEDEENVQLIN